MIDVSRYPVLDHHCHAFLPEKEEAKGELFAQFFSWSPVPVEQSENLILFRKILIELKRILGTSSDTPKEIISQRDETYRKTPHEYIGRLFDDARIVRLFFDTGYPSAEYPGSYDADPESLGKTFAKQTFNFVFRIDKLMWNLFQKPLTFTDMLNRYQEGIASVIKRDRFIGYKSVIAYGFGLDIHDHETADAKRAYDKLRTKKVLSWPLEKKDEGILAQEKIVRDFLTCRAIEKSIEFDIPFQIHTGIGESPIINAQKCNPVLLYDLFRKEKLGKAKFVLDHGGYPFFEEIGWLVNSFPNVYADLSCTIPWIHYGSERAVLRILEMAPTNKIFYGSDGGKIPETYWIGALLGKEGVGKAMQALVDAKLIDEDYAHKTAQGILFENAKRLYKIQ
jgi:predicted TIM-barrel fold metal-dependent hydrolase